jgi:hypothetical protein
VKKYVTARAVILMLAGAAISQTGATADKHSVATTQSPIPEEARKHFVMGTTLFKDAKTADDFVEVESEFKQATDLALQWPEARYSLALAKEAAGDYPGAVADLKFYQKFNLSDSEARTVQDKIYALEAKAERAARKQAEEHRAAAAQKAQDAANEQARAIALQTWTDPATGLMWTKDTSSSDVNWNQASSYCSNLRLASYSNWRLATIDELAGIYDPTQNADGPSVKGGITFHKRDVWSSSAGKASGAAWTFYFSTGHRDSLQMVSRDSIHALCVRRSGE